MKHVFTFLITIVFSFKINAQIGVIVAGGNGMGSALNQIWEPNGISMAANGYMYIADGKNNRVQKWLLGDTLGVTVAGGNGQGNAANQLDYIWGLAVDTALNVYIPDNSNHRIQKWAPGASSANTIASGLGNPIAAYVTKTGDVYAVGKDATLLKLNSLQKNLLRSLMNYHRA